MRIIRNLAILASAIITVTAALQAQTVDEIVDKHLAATGGKEAISKLQSRSVVGTVTVSTPGGDVKGSIETWAKSPNKIRSLVRMDLSAFGMGEMVMDQRFDGATGFILDSMNGNREMTESQLASMKASRFPSALLGYKDLDMTLELGEPAKVGDRDAVVLIMTPKGGTPLKLYFDAETYYELKVVQMVDDPQTGGNMEQATEFSDFRDIDGVKIPFEMRIANAARETTIRITKVEHNTDLDDAMFSKPAGN